jgi:hypothetical protein
MGKASGLIRWPRSGSLPQKSEQQQQRPGDPAPYTTFTRIPASGPTNDVNGTVDESTITSSDMNGAITQDVITKITQGTSSATSSTFVVATTPSPTSSLDGVWSIWSDIATELISTTIMTTITVGAGAKETSSVSLSSNNANSFLDTTPPTPSSSMPAIKTATRMTMEPTDVECLYGRAATPESHHPKGDGDLAQGSDDRLPQKNSCLPNPSSSEKQRNSGTGDPAMWNAILNQLPLLQYIQSIMLTSAVIYAFVKDVVRGRLGCAWSRPQRYDSPGPTIMTYYIRKSMRRPRRSAAHNESIVTIFVRKGDQKCN